MRHKPVAISMLNGLKLPAFKTDSQFYWYFVSKRKAPLRERWELKMTISRHDFESERLIKFLFH